jgi:signal transduction histidine kinase
MIFQRIERSLALQLTVFVFMLLIANGTLFLAADISNARRELNLRLLQESQLVQRALPDDLRESIQVLPIWLRERVRIIDNQGNTIYQGAFFDGIPFSYSSDDGVATVMIQDDAYDLLTTPIVESEEFLGYMQIMRPEQDIERGLPLRAFMYLVLSVGISSVTYLVGRYFARQSLKPAVESMERLEQFTQDASHELRTPLTVLGSSLDLALRTKHYEDGILSAKQDLKQIVQLVEKLLELARLDRFAVKPAPIDLSSLVQEQSEKFQSVAADAGLTLSAEIAPRVTAEGDGALIRQVLTNLVSNAIRFTRPGGTVTVRLSPGTLTVSDTGIGIAQDALTKIFERFYQSENSRSQGGYGLGLALVKRIIDLHRWTIGVKSVLNKGTAFTVTFPVSSRKDTKTA